MAPTVSIVIPTRNGAATLPALLDMISRQQTNLAIETVAIDSGSTDGTLALIRRRIDRLIEIPRERFDHGVTRNAAIAQARGDLIVLLVQDAIPASEHWLAALTAPFFADGCLAGAFARQQPRDDAGALTRYYLARGAASSELPKTNAVTDAASFHAMAPFDRFTLCAFDNVCSCIRRSVWEAHRFEPTDIAEDLEWARAVLLAGYRIAYVPEAVVIHSHNRSSRYEFERTYLLHRRLFELFGLRTIPTLPKLGRSIASSLALHWRCSRPVQSSATNGGIGRPLGLAVAWPVGQYLGGLSAAHRWKPRRSGLV